MCGVVWCRGLLCVREMLCACCVRVCVLVCACWCVRVGVCVLVLVFGVGVLVCVVAVLVCVLLCVGVCVSVFVVVWHAENLRVCIQHVPVCAFKMSPCVPATCPHVFFMWACCRCTLDVLNAHTQAC